MDSATTQVYTDTYFVDKRLRGIQSILFTDGRSA